MVVAVSARGCLAAVPLEMNTTQVRVPFHAQPDIAYMKYRGEVQYKKEGARHSVKVQQRLCCQGPCKGKHIKEEPIV